MKILSNCGKILPGQRQLKPQAASGTGTGLCTAHVHPTLPASVSFQPSATLDAGRAG